MKHRSTFQHWDEKMLFREIWWNLHLKTLKICDSRCCDGMVRRTGRLKQRQERSEKPFYFVALPQPFFWSSQQLGSAFLLCVILAMGWGWLRQRWLWMGLPSMMMMPWGKGKGKAGLYWFDRHVARAERKNVQVYPNGNWTEMLSRTKIEGCKIM